MSPAKKAITAGPFLKWSGGKRQIMPQLLQHVPETFGRYHEPFLGAGALFFVLEAAGRLDHGSFLRDSNKRLIRTWRAIQTDVEGVIKILDELQTGYIEDTDPRDFFESVRDTSPDDESDAVIAAWMIFLNKTCFNGLYRVNRLNKFNVPHGKHKKMPTICNAEGLRAVAASLNYKTMISPGDYLTTLKMATAGDFVYFDPPYAPVTKTANFTGYTTDGFGPGDQRELRNVALLLKKRGVHVLLSNSSAPIIDELYQGDFEIIKIQARRAINSKGDGRGPVMEYIIK